MSHKKEASISESLFKKEDTLTHCFAFLLSIILFKK